MVILHAQQVKSGLHDLPQGIPNIELLRQSAHSTANPCLRLCSHYLVVMQEFDHTSSSWPTVGPFWLSRSLLLAMQACAHSRPSWSVGPCSAASRSCSSTRLHTHAVEAQQRSSTSAAILSTHTTPKLRLAVSAAAAAAGCCCPDGKEAKQAQEAQEGGSRRAHRHCSHGCKTGSL